MNMLHVGLIFLGFATLIGVAFWLARMRVMKRARAEGYDSVRQYLYAIPTSDEQRFDAVELALKGLVITFLGVLFAPLMFVGLIPTYYGFRKVILCYIALPSESTGL